MPHNIHIMQSQFVIANLTENIDYNELCGIMEMFSL